MDKSTLSNYGWIVIACLVLCVMIALASPFGHFIEGGVKSTVQGLFDVNQEAGAIAGLDIPDQTIAESNTSADTKIRNIKINLRGSFIKTVDETEHTILYDLLQELMNNQELSDMIFINEYCIENYDISLYLLDTSGRLCSLRQPLKSNTTYTFEPIHFSKKVFYECSSNFDSYIQSNTYKVVYANYDIYEPGTTYKNKYISLLYDPSDTTYQDLVPSMAFFWYMPYWADTTYAPINEYYIGEEGTGNDSIHQFIAIKKQDGTIAKLSDTFTEGEKISAIYVTRDTTSTSYEIAIASLNAKDYYSGHPIKLETPYSTTYNGIKQEVIIYADGSATQYGDDGSCRYIPANSIKFFDEGILFANAAVAISPDGNTINAGNGMTFTATPTSGTIVKDTPYYQIGDNSTYAIVNSDGSISAFQNNALVLTIPSVAITYSKNTITINDGNSTQNIYIHPSGTKIIFNNTIYSIS